MTDLSSPKDVRESLEAQIADLKAEMSRISRSVQARAADAAEGARDTFEAARSRADGAARTVGRQAHAVSDVIGENPGTAAAVLSSAGVVGALVGLAAGYLLAGGLRR
ncbi:hypothetical protein V5F53_10105 [Xanthobacter sp. V4C-4]|uniref:hypothetical protein n=1 Tax=Xanthobacter cornucopiae TaxID=3119924 RepID=UPI00372CAF54